jgi:hypothetical protein
VIAGAGAGAVGTVGGATLGAAGWAATGAVGAPAVWARTACGIALAINKAALRTATIGAMVLRRAALVR